MAALSYRDWADLLSAHLLRPENAGRPLFLFVDDGLIAQLAETPDEPEAVDQFIRSLRREMGDEARDTLFDAIVDRSVRWFDGPATGSPHALPFLAATVLAASRMAAEGTVASHNYYVRLRDLLGLPGHGMPRGFDWASSTLWLRMSTWLDMVMRGELGVSTIPAHPRLPYVGPPISQALWRTSDRQRLFEFLEATGRRPGNLGDPADLLAHFRRWAQEHGGLSPGVRLMVAKPDLGEQLELIVRAEASGWDGSAAGRVRTNQILLLMTSGPLGEISLAFIARRAPGAAPEAVALDPSGQSVHFHAIDDWYEIDVRPGPVNLENGLSVTADGARFALDPRPLRVLIQQPELGGWLVVTAPVSGVPVRLLVREHLAPITADYLGRAAEPGWGRRTIEALPGWVLFDAVRLQAERPAPDDARLARLAVLRGDVFSLDGGLVMDGPRSYLAGGEPDVRLLPSLGIPWLPVMVDDRLVGEASSGAPLELRSLGLTPGDHVLTVGGAGTQFKVTDGTSARASDGPDGPWREVGGALTDGALIKTAGSVAPDPEPIVLRRGYHYALLGAVPGQVEVIPGWVKPRWMRRVGLEPVAYEVWPSFQVAWIASRGRQVRRLRLLDPSGPGSAPSDRGLSDLVKSWAHWLLKTEPWLDPADTPTRAVLDRYLEVARTIVGDD